MAGMRLYPWTIIYLFVALFALGSVPALYVLGTEGLGGLLLGAIDKNLILQAYVWTIFTCLILLLFAHVTGVQINMRAYIRRDMQEKPEKYYLRLWKITLAVSLMMTGWMFGRTGCRIPILESLGLDFITAAQLRQTYETVINQNIFNLHLYGVGVFNCVIALYGIKTRRSLFLTVSFVQLFFICAFSLAKSPVVNVLLILMIFYALVKPISMRNFVAIPVIFLLVIFPWYAISGIGENTGQSFIQLVAERIFLGQWAALPFYFDIFRDSSPSVCSVLPPYLNFVLSGYGFEWGQSPSRLAMRAIVGDAVVDGGGAGVATTFFIGEAYALGGILGIVLAIGLVAIQIWFLAYLFLHLRKNIFTVYLYAFMLFKFCMGMISGVSAFMLSGFTFVLGAITLFVFGAQAATSARLRKS